MYELFKEVFDSLPHVQRIWVNQAGEYFLHPKHGCELVERTAAKQVTEQSDSEVVVEKKPKKDKQK